MDDTKEEIWKPYPKYPSIEASNFGRIRTKDRYVRNGKGLRLVKGRILKQRYDKDGYLYVSTSINGKNITLRAHRIVASAFIPNPNNYPEVNHIDCNRANNVVSNLEWCTSKYNSQYRDKLGHFVNNNPGKLVFAINLETGKVLRFESQSEAARQLGVSQGNICEALKGLYTQFKGYLFTEDENEITPQKIREVRNNMYFLGGVIVVDLNGFKVLRFETQAEASRQLGIRPSDINTVLKGRQKTAHGFCFYYEDKNTVEKVRSKFGDEVAGKVEKLIRQNQKQ